MADSEQQFVQLSFRSGRCRKQQNTNSNRDKQMGHGNLKWTKIGLGALTAAAVSLPLQACNTAKTDAEKDAAAQLFHSGYNRGVKTHLEEERRIREQAEQDNKTAETIISIFGDPNKDKKKKKKKPVTQSSEGGGSGGGAD